jgi:hypothetical protein
MNQREARKFSKGGKKGLKSRHERTQRQARKDSQIGRPENTKTQARIHSNAGKKRLKGRR